MSNDHNKELLEEATSSFQSGDLKSAEPLINQLILGGHKSPEVFHMLGTILYDQGKFGKAIRSFRRALELDPSYTDASIGLSIILNDLGRYDEGKKVFEEAQVMLAQKAEDEDPYLEEKIAMKHDELGELYCKYKKFDKGLAQYEEALELSSRVPELTLKIVNCYEQMAQPEQAIQRIKPLIKQFPEYYTAKNKLGQLYFETNQIPEAIATWEEVLSRDPENAKAKKMLSQAQNIEFVPAQEAEL